MEDRRDAETAAATRIEAAYRSFLVRKRLSALNAASVRLQRAFRGWVGRREAAARREEQDRALRRAYFDLCAATIQRHWRGHYSRSSIHDFRARREYLTAVLDKGERVRAESHRAAQETAEAQRREGELRVAERTRAQMERMHHLLSTEARPGVLNNPYLNMLGQPSTISGRPAEELLRETARATVTLPPLRPRKEVLRPETYKGVPRAVGAGVSLRCAEPYGQERAERSMQRAVEDATMRSMHPAPFQSSLARPPRAAKVPALNASLPFAEVRGGGLPPRNDKVTAAARKISPGAAWSSATHPHPVFDKTIL